VYVLQHYFQPWTVSTPGVGKVWPAGQTWPASPPRPVSCNFMTGPQYHLWSGPWPGISHSHSRTQSVTVTQWAMHCNLICYAGYSHKQPAAAAPSGKWVSRHPASRHVAVVLEPIVVFIPIRSAASSLEGHLALYHQKFADSWSTLQWYYTCRDNDHLHSYTAVGLYSDCVSFKQYQQKQENMCARCACLNSCCIVAIIVTANNVTFIFAITIIKLRINFFRV